MTCPNSQKLFVVFVHINSWLVSLQMMHWSIAGTDLRICLLAKDVSAISVDHVCLFMVCSFSRRFLHVGVKEKRALLKAQEQICLSVFKHFVVGFSNCACVTRPGLVSPQFSLHTCRLLKIPELLQGFGIGSWLRWGFVLRSVSLWGRLCDGVEWGFVSTRRDCAISVRATRHTVDSAIDPVCPLGAA